MKDNVRLKAPDFLMKSCVIQDVDSQKCYIVMVRRVRSLAPDDCQDLNLFGLQATDQMGADEATGSGYQRSFLLYPKSFTPSRY
ncbi:hypothetical protein SAMN02745133_00392 [Desulforamulus putei DSM 12395]|uniref:Uncharacterized protein n=1 Tax=Desulforamulus putei DSM 12395 TaxID=1121429 RepID=A0A1M4T8X2_9FIRM|nr:hypothetical protein SAMN02745133_00392 [Desulforamulus putei DSM 12395]